MRLLDLHKIVQGTAALRFTISWVAVGESS
jgi:hypothetical protein